MADMNRREISEADPASERAQAYARPRFGREAIQHAEPRHPLRAPLCIIAFCFVELSVLASVLFFQVESAWSKAQEMQASASRREKAQEDAWFGKGH